MRKEEVQVGRLYQARVSGKMATVRIEAVHPAGGWFAINVATNRRVRLRTAGRLHGRVFATCAEHVGQLGSLDCAECKEKLKRTHAILDRKLSPLSWVRNASYDAAKEAFAGYVHDLFTARYLFYGQGVLRVVPEETGQKLGLTLGASERVPSSYTIEQLTNWIDERARRLPCLPEEPK